MRVRQSLKVTKEQGMSACKRLHLVKCIYICVNSGKDLNIYIFIGLQSY